MKVFLITLQRKVERRVNVFYLMRDFSHQGFEPVEFPATDLSEPEFRDIEIARRQQMEVPLTAGELACSWSHIRAYRQIVEDGEPAFIVEDDAHFTYPLREVEVRHIPHFLSLSAYDPHDREQENFKVISKGATANQVMGLPYGTQCYYTTPEAAEILLELLVPVRWPSDVGLSRASQQDRIITHLAHHPIAIQHPVIASYIGAR